MGLEKPYNGAWQEIESVNKPVNGAWQECEAVCKPKDGAWEEIWSAVKWLVEQSNDITNGWLEITDEGLTFEFNKYMDVSDGQVLGSMTGGGTIVFYLDGEWTDPVIEFDWEGEFGRYNADWSSWYTASAGSIAVFARTTSGTENKITAVSSIKPEGANTGSSDTEMPDGSGSYSNQLSGNYDRLGLEITVASYNGTFYRAMLEVIVKNLKIDGKKIGFPVSSEFDYQEF